MLNGLGSIYKIAATKNVICAAKLDIKRDKANPTAAASTCWQLWRKCSWRMFAIERRLNGLLMAGCGN
jgi:hypothetical protein